MFDEYKDTQKLAYTTLINQIKNNKYSHAYLFEVNGYNNIMNFTLSFIKALLCHHNYTDKSNCNECSICHRIDNNNYPDLKIINPDGLWIKKEQIDELEKEFSTKSIESGKKIYIINEAEKLNVQASNTILKFLEEPEPNIIAILITNNIYQVLPTIKSRCQVISFNSLNKNIIISEEDQHYLNNINEFVKKLEKEKFDTILFTNNLWHDIFKDRVEYQKGFDLLLYYYKELLNIKLGRKIELFKDFENDMILLSNKLSFDNIIYKINKIIELKENIKVNANQNLLLDKLIIELSRGEYNE